MTRLLRRAWPAALGCAAVLALAPSLAGSSRAPASAPHGGVADTPPAERALRAQEERTLGPVHAAEHAQLRARAADTATADAAAAAAPSLAATATPAEAGQWTPKFSIPGVAVHAVLLRTGKILYFTGTTQGRAFLLDPVTRTTKAVYPPKIPGGEDEPANIFCAGQSILDDGTVLVMGGTVGRREGLKTIFTFDPIAETWRQQADMRHGRWYPTQVLLADGRTVVLDGLDERGEPHVNNQIESYTTNIDFVTLLSVRGEADHPPAGGLYPHTFQMPSGRVLVAGPEPTDSWFFRLSKVGALSWEDAANPARHTFGSGVLLPGTPQGSTRVALIGGVNRGALPDTGSSTPLPLVEVFDETNPAAGWTAAPSLNHGRAHHNTVQLPDGSMVTVGGGYGILNGNRRSGDAAVHRNIELYDPVTGQWRLGPAQDELRTYHSVALLLPDARVMSAGDDGYGGSTNDTAEIYEPPYLFRGPRPQILSAPAEITYGQTVTVDTSADAAKAVLVAPAAVTHANDMSQRVVPLTATAGPAGKLTFTAPAASTLAPPSYYMLFVLNTDGVPSVAKFVRLKFGSPPGPPDTELTSGPPAETQSTAARFEFRSNEQGTTFRCRLDGGTPTPCSSPWDYAGLSAGAHSFQAAAVDAAGTADSTPATWSWTVNPALPDTRAPETTVTYGPVSTYATTARLEFASDESGGSFTCKLDAGAWSACSSPQDYAALSVGPHAFSVRAVDAAGNVDVSPAAWSWTVLDPPSATGDLTVAPGATGLVDSTPPRLRTRIRRKQGRIVVEATCRNEACTATAGGSLRAPGAARAFKLRTVSAHIAQGTTTTFRLRYSRGAVRIVRRAWRRNRRVKATVFVTAKDSAGNAASTRQGLRLKR